MRVHRVMNCKDWEDEEFIPGSYGSFKYDGVRGFYYPGERVLYSRDNKPLYGFDHIISDLRTRCNRTIDMELILPGYDDWNKMSGAIRNYQQKPDGYAWVIDVPADNLVFEDRRDLILEVASLSKYLLIMNQLKLTTLAQANLMYEYAIQNGYEGIVAKTPGHRYKNQRSYHWMRKVPFISVDCKVISIYPGKGKLAGAAGGMFVEAPTGAIWKVGTMKGVDFYDRADMLKNPGHYIGRTAEIHFKEYQPSGMPRQPRFKRWRLDK